MLGRCPFCRFVYPTDRRPTPRGITGRALYRHLSLYGYRNKTFRVGVGSPRIGQNVGDALAIMIGAHPLPITVHGGADWDRSLIQWMSVRRSRTRASPPRPLTLPKGSGSLWWGPRPDPPANDWPTGGPA